MSVPIKLLWQLGEKKGIEQPRESIGSIDISDTLNWKATPVLLAICAFIIGGSQAFGEPISCIHPLEIKVWYKYVSAYCFLEGSYSMGSNNNLSTVAGMHKMDRKVLQMENPVEFYQWVPFFLSLQLIMFLSPGLFWKWARKRQSLDLDSIIEHTEAIRDSMGDPEAREGKMHDIVEYLYETLRASPTDRDRCSLTLLLLIVKFVTLMNAVYQFIFLVQYIGERDAFFGYEIIQSFMAGSMTSRFFPLEVLCDLSFSTRLAQSQDYTMQCILSLNYFHDKMFGLLWLWYIFLITYSMVTFLLFSFSLLPFESSIRPHFSTSLYETNKNSIREFYYKMLLTDGTVILNFISKLKGHNLSSEIAGRLFTKYEQIEAISAWVYPHSLKTKPMNMKTYNEYQN